MTGEGMTSPRSWLVFTHAPGCDIMISHSSGTWETRPASGVPPITFTTEAPEVPFGWSVLGRPNYMLSFAVKSAEMEVVPAGWKTTFFVFLVGRGLVREIQEVYIDTANGSDLANREFLEGGDDFNIDFPGGKRVKVLPLMRLSGRLWRDNSQGPSLLTSVKVIYESDILDLFGLRINISRWVCPRVH